MKRRAKQEMHPHPNAEDATPLLSLPPEQERMAALQQIMQDEWDEKLILPIDQLVPSSCRTFEAA